MKEVAIFYRDRENPKAIQYLEDIFYDVLGGYIHRTNYYTNEFEPGQQIDADDPDRHDENCRRDGEEYLHGDLFDDIFGVGPA